MKMKEMKKLIKKVINSEFVKNFAMLTPTGLVPMKF